MENKIGGEFGHTLQELKALAPLGKTINGVQFEGNAKKVGAILALAASAGDLIEIIEQLQAVNPVEWRPMDTAPTDGTMVLLNVRFTENPTEDEETATTIGANSFGLNEIEGWSMAGWNWTQDCFTAGQGEPIGWLPIKSYAINDPSEVERLKNELRIERERSAGFMRVNDELTNMVTEIVNHPQTVLNNRMRTAALNMICDEKGNDL